MDSRRLERFIPLVVFLFALLVRLPGMGWGLKNDIRNASLHPDEAVIFGYSRSIVPALGQFTPHFYNYPTLYLTTLRIASDVTTAYTGAPKTKEEWSWTDPTKTDWDWVSRCHTAGRWLGVLAGAATAAIVFGLARRIAGQGAGIVASLVIAVAPAFVVHSRFQATDVMATMFVAAALFYAVRALDSKDERARLMPATWCGILTGLATGTKYTGILVVFALYVALAIAKRPTAVREGLVATLLAFGVFVLTTPGVLLETEAFKRDFLFEMGHTAAGHDWVFSGTSSGFIFHLANLFLGVGPILVLLGLVGFGFGLFRKVPALLALAAFALPYYVLIGRAEVKFMRYTFPLLPPLAVAVGFAVAEAQKRKGLDKLAVAATILGVGGIPGGGIKDSVLLTAKMAGEDPRDAAGRFLKGDPKSVGIARDPWYWSATLIPDGAAQRGATWPVLRQEIQSSATPPIVYPLTDEGAQTRFDLRVFDAKPDRIVVTSLEAGPATRLKNAKNLPSDIQIDVLEANAWLDRLQAEYLQERVFGTDGTGVDDMDYVQPQVIVWKRKTP